MEHPFCLQVTVAGDTFEAGYDDAKSFRDGLRTLALLFHVTSPESAMCSLEIAMRKHSDAKETNGERPAV